MKYAIYCIVFLMAVFVVGCEEEETPFNEFEDLGKGAIPRLVEGPVGIFDFFNPDESEIAWTVEFVDDDFGRNVASYSWDVSYREVIAGEFDITPEESEIVFDTMAFPRDSIVLVRDTVVDDGGNRVITERDSVVMYDSLALTPIDTIITVEADTVVIVPNEVIEYGPVDLLTVESSDFTTNDDGLQQATIALSLDDVLGALGVEFEDVDAGGVFSFTGVLTKTDGSTFSEENTNPNLIGQPAFNAFFSFNQALVCPSDIGGTFIAESSGTSTDECCTGEVFTATDTVTLVNNGGGLYDLTDFSGGLYLAWYGPDRGNYGITTAEIAGGQLTTQLVDACSNVSIPTFTEVFGSDVEITNFSFDEESGVFSYTFTNGFGDTGDVVLTPVEM